MSERLHPALRSAHEKLCIAQTDVPAEHREALGDALAIVERVGVMTCPDWSKYREPTTEFDE